MEGDPEQRVRERRIRRRALATSVAIQGAALAALLLVPLFGKTERIAFAYMTPVPPYRPSTPMHPNTPASPSQPTKVFTFCLTCPVPISRPHGPSRTEEQSPGIPVIEGDPNSISNCTGCLPIPGREGPIPPQTLISSTPQRLVVTHIDPALLIHRVEPVYPPLARQTGRGGRVELRAIIATDGSIQSLQVVSGDPLFTLSALDAVRQWRYRPTFLNGKPVEIDTFISVIYNISR